MLTIPPLDLVKGYAWFNLLRRSSEDRALNLPFNTSITITTDYIATYSPNVIIADGNSSLPLPTITPDKAGSVVFLKRLSGTVFIRRGNNVGLYAPGSVSNVTSFLVNSVVEMYFIAGGDFSWYGFN